MDKVVTKHFSVWMLILQSVSFQATGIERLGALYRTMHAYEAGIRTILRPCSFTTPRLLTYSVQDVEKLFHEYVYHVACTCAYVASVHEHGTIYGIHRTNLTPLSWHQYCNYCKKVQIQPDTATMVESAHYNLHTRSIAIAGRTLCDPRLVPLVLAHEAVHVLQHISAHGELGPMWENTPSILASLKHSIGLIHMPLAPSYTYDCAGSSPTVSLLRLHGLGCVHAYGHSHTPEQTSSAAHQLYTRYMEHVSVLTTSDVVRPIEHEAWWMALCCLKDTPLPYLKNAYEESTSATTIHPSYKTLVSLWEASRRYPFLIQNTSRIV